MRPEAAALLWDVERAADRTATFTNGLNLDFYKGDELHRSAVERQLLIIGEALNSLRKVDVVTAERIPDLVRIIGLRNVLAHGYAVIDDEVIWQAATRRVPELRTVVAGLLGDA